MPRARTVVFLLAVVPCVPILLALFYWLKLQGSLRDCSNYVRLSQESKAVFPSLYLSQNITLHREVHVDSSIDTNRGQSSHHDPPSWLEVDQVDLALSEHSEIDIRGKFQHRRIGELCRKHFFTKEQHFPRGDQLKTSYRHLMFDDREKVIFCFVPKIGCTNMKRLMLYMGGHLPQETIDWPWVEDHIYLEPALKTASLMNNSLTQHDITMRLQTYYKFMVVRNPLERLLSGYINKIEPPVRYKSRHKFPDSIKLEILNMQREGEVQYWLQTASENLFNISVTFPEFVRYFIETDSELRNEHFRPSMDICHPCLVQYNFYGNFKNFSHDTSALIKKFQTDPRYYRDESLHPTQEQTNIKLARYFSQLSFRDKMQLFGVLYDELLFYYSLYPSELASHQRVLGINLPPVQ